MLLRKATEAIWRDHLGRAKRICYLSPMRAAKVQASLRIRAVSPEPSLLAHTNSESRGTFRQKARSLAPLNGWACAVKICHDGMLEDTNSLDGAHFCKKCIRSLITKSLPVLSMELWLRNKDPSLNGKRNFCYCLSTELSISSVVGYFLHECLLIGSVDSTGREIGITPVTCTCII